MDRPAIDDGSGNGDLPFCGMSGKNGIPRIETQGEQTLEKVVLMRFHHGKVGRNVSLDAYIFLDGTLQGLGKVAENHGDRERRALSFLFAGKHDKSLGDVDSALDCSFSHRHVLFHRRIRPPA